MNPLLRVFGLRHPVIRRAGRARLIRSIAGAALMLCVLAPVAFSARAQATPGDGPVPELVRVPLKGAGAFGRDVEMVTQVFLPPGDGPFPVVIYSHGRAGEYVERLKLRAPIPHGHVRYWVRKGFAVVASIRPGYGETGGIDREDSGVHYDVFGNCNGRPALSEPARHAAAAVRASLDCARPQRWSAAEQILLVGQSMGGLATIAAAADSPPGVVGYINFSGGAGGNPARSPGRSCDAEAMSALMAEFGKITRVPNLWLYAENDLYWGPDSPRAWHAAYAKGGARRNSSSPPRFQMQTVISSCFAAESYGACTPIDLSTVWGYPPRSPRTERLGTPLRPSSPRQGNSRWG
jgi:dienelactone hydrolase